MSDPINKNTDGGDAAVSLNQRDLDTMLDNLVAKFRSRGVNFSPADNKRELTRDEQYEVTVDILRAVASGDKPQARQIAQRAGILDTGATSTGGVLVPEIFMKDILNLENPDGVLERESQSFSWKGGDPEIAFTTANPTVNWVNETEQKPITTMDFATKKISQRTMAGIIPVSNQLYSNSAVNLLPIISMGFRGAITSKAEEDIAQGVVVGQEGLYKVPGKTKHTITGTDFDEVTLKDLLSARTKLYEHASSDVAGAKWYMSGSVYETLLNDTTSPGGLYKVGGAADSPVGLIHGIPVVVVKDAPQVGATPLGTKEFIVLGNLKKHSWIFNWEQVAIDLSRDATYWNGTTWVSAFQNNLTLIRAERTMARAFYKPNELISVATA